MRPTDFISIIALLLVIFASLFSVITYVKELQIEEHIRHLHKHNLNITSILRLDKDIAHLFRTLGMENNRADRLRHLLQINANASSNSTEGERGLTEINYRIFPRNTTSQVPITPTGNTFNKSEGEN